MTVEEKSRSILREAGLRDPFPVGMRVLAVDDDPTCLRVLEAKLLECKYHVTTTNQAVKALKLLRENKDKFDLVISDVHMPDMDGFKLLELVGLEMDLPVIMLSGNSDTNVVMKGITHGACDYLLKPVRLEQLRTIWQHVVRRKKFNSKDFTNYDHGDDSENPHQTSDGEKGPSMNGPSDRYGKPSRKRKDQNEEDEDESEENGHENEDPSTQKKARVIWTPELHRKFVAAVNHLGIEKAVPKRILDLMKVEKLTRENVASHLQKYRLLLKKISSQENRQANIVAGLGGKDSYLPIGSIDGMRNYNALAGSRQLPTLTSFQSSGILGRLNSPTGLGLHGLASNGTIQLGHAQNSTNSFIYDFGNPPHVNIPGIHHGNLPQGMPTSLELEQLRQQKQMNETNDHMRACFSNNRLPTGSSSNSFLSVTNNALMLQAHQQQAQCSGLGNQPSIKMATLSLDPFQINVGTSSCLTNMGRCNDTWQGAVPLTGYSTNNLPVRASCGIESLSSCNNFRENISAISSQADINPQVSPSGMVGAPLFDPTGNLQYQTNSLDGNALLTTASANETSGFSNFGNVSSLQKWGEKTQNQTCRPDIILNSALSSNLPNHDMLTSNSKNLGYNSRFGDKEIDATVFNQSSPSAPFLTQQFEAEKFTGDGQLKLQAGFSSSGYNTYDDVVNAMLKPEQEDVLLMDGDIGCDIFSLETCI